MACIFCDITAGRLPASVVWQDDVCVAFMDLYPLREGHVLVAPRTHAALLNELPAETRDHLFRIACRVIAAQKAIGLHADGANLVVNDGKPANQHVPHVHVHAIPRRGGDLGGIAWQAATRFLNPLGLAARRRRLDALPRRGGDLGGIAWQAATRFLNPLGLAARRRRLDALAARIAAHL